MKNAKALKTQRLTLRPFRKKDASVIYKGWGGDPEVSKYTLWKTNESLDDVKKFVASIISNQEALLYNWIVELTHTKKAIGSLGVTNIDMHNKSCEIGYCYAKKYWRKGYATEALKKALNYLFKEKDFLSVTSYHHILNPASGAVMKKCGMRLTHTKVVYNPIKKEYFSAHYYIINNTD